MRFSTILAAFAVAGCAACAGAHSRPQSTAPAAARAWEDSPRARSEAGSRVDPRGYPPGDDDEAWRATSAEQRDTSMNASGVQRRILGSRASAFMHGVSSATGALPLRERTWPVDARAVAASADSVVFATPWQASARVADRGACSPRASSRLVGAFVAQGDDLVLRAYLEESGPSGCMSPGAVRDHVEAMMDDLELYARAAARAGMPAPSAR